MQCNEEFDNSKLMKMIEKQEIQRCVKCGTGLIKPDIVLFGDQLPARFYNSWLSH
jgi:NAD-dependent SIR2 family protein deacetylase